MDTSLLVGSADIRAPLAWDVVIQLALGSMPVWALFRRFQWDRRAAAARAVKTAGTIDREGVMVVGGTAQPEVGTDAPVTVDIVQHGREWKHKGRLKHSWTETSRTTRVAPFWLFADSGEVVRVEPPDRVTFADELDVTIPGDATTRTRRAQLSPGEKVFVAGKVKKREGDPPWAVVPHDDGTMLLSTRALDADATAMANAWRTVAILSGIVFLIGCCCVFPGELLAVSGVRVDAEQPSWTTWQTHDKHGYHTHYGVDATWRRAGEPDVKLHDELSHGAWSSASSNDPATVPFVVVPFATWDQAVGVEPTESFAVPLLSGFALVGVAFLSWLIQKAAVPWYQRPKVIDSGDGPLKT
jgi:hypothetical protein